ncbi:hypothetical protein CLOM_g3757, partial [Closterium sp. NIES-68]
LRGGLRAAPGSGRAGDGREIRVPQVLLPGVAGHFVSASGEHLVQGLSSGGVRGFYLWRAQGTGLLEGM